MKISYLFFLVVLFLSPFAEAKTWYVEKDGSGDYSVIQDAINASSSGDTIRVGSGRFNDQTINHCTESDHPARVIFNKEELTLIGSGPENTIIGQEEPWELSQGRHMGIVVGRCGNLRYSISNLSIENSCYGVLGGTGTVGKVEGCVLSGHAYGLLLFSNDVEVNNCVFHTPTENTTYPRHLVFQGDNSISVTRCQFQSNSAVEPPTNHFVQMGSAVVFVASCSFEGGELGVWVYGGQTSIVSCSFTYLSGFGVGFQGGDTVVTDSQFSDVAIGISERDGGGYLEVERCEFRNISEITFYTTLASTGFFHDCLLEKGERYVVGPPLAFDKFQRDSNEEISHFDMTDNWWGTTDPDSIQAWIRDRNDFPEYPFFQEIDYEPYKGNAVPVEKTSFGGLKALFKSSLE